MGCLYQISFPNGKSYIGITSKTAEHRFKGHCKKKNGPSALGAAIRKYGIESSIVKTLVVADDWGYLCELEKKAIVAFNTKSPHGYNMTEGGDGVVDPSVEVRKIKSEKHIAYFSDPAARAAHSAIKRAHGADPNVRQRMSESQKARFADPVIRQQNSARQKLAHSSEEMRTKHRVNTLAHNAAHPEKIEQQRHSLLAHYADAEKRKAHADKMRAFYQTEKGKLSIEKMRSKKLGKVTSESTKQKMSVAQTGRLHSAESKARMSASLRAAWERRKAEANG